MENVYLGRQPIIDDKGSLYSYDILYLDSKQETDNEHYSSALVLSSVLNKFGMKAFFSENKAFVKIDQKFLMNDLIFSVPNNIFIFALSGEIEMSRKVLEKIQQLKAQDYTLAIDEISLDAQQIEKYKPILNALSFVKINVHSVLGHDVKSMVDELKSHDIKVIAVKIEDDAEYELTKNIGCELFQGYYFAKPKILENAKNDANKMNVLKLYNLLLQDTNIDEIVSEFENNHALTLQLLQFINSGAFHFRTHISSIHHVLMLIGRKPLAQWLMLMIYSKSLSSKIEVSPLMLMIKNRTELMENLLKAIKPDVKSNALGEAYFVGVLSLIDSVFGVKLEEILESMNVSDSVKSALLHDEGTLGKLYVVVRDIEAFNIGSITEFASKYKVAMDDIQRVVVQSMENVNNFQRELAS